MTLARKIIIFMQQLDYKIEVIFLLQGDRNGY